jgi:hypothetical protein
LLQKLNEQYNDQPKHKRIKTTKSPIIILNIPYMNRKAKFKQLFAIPDNITNLIPFKAIYNDPLPIITLKNGKNISEHIVRSKFPK